MKTYTKNLYTYGKLIACVATLGLTACGAPRDPLLSTLSSRPAASSSVGTLSNCAATPIDYAGKINGIKQKPDYCLQADAFGGCPGFHIGVGDFHAQILANQTIAIIGNSMFAELQYSTVKVAYQRANEKIWRDINVLVGGTQRKADFSVDDLGKNMILENMTAQDLASASSANTLNGVKSIMVYISEFYKQSIDLSASLSNNLFTFTAAEAVGDVPNKYNELGFWQLIDADTLRGSCAGQGSVVTNTLNSNNTANNSSVLNTATATKTGTLN